MINRYNFELILEKIAEQFYFNGAVHYGKVRGGNSKENEAYFAGVSVGLRRELACQQILLKKGSCPDSGVFGNFNYKNEDDVSWDLVEQKKIVVIQIDGAERLKRYIEVRIEDFPQVKEPVKRDSGIEVSLNDLDEYGELFGVEYKASKSKTENSISVASFNSTCPSATKTVAIKKARLIHNFKSKTKDYKIKSYALKDCDFKLNINLSMYYLIVNDYPKKQVSEIKQIFICDGAFFAPEVSQERAEALSVQYKPHEMKIDYELERVGLRYRPFFESKTIRAKGYGLYTSWEPKLLALEKEEQQRQVLMDEVEKVKQDFLEKLEDEEGNEVEVNDQVDEKSISDDNVIYLNLRDERIKKRAA